MCYLIFNFNIVLVSIIDTCYEKNVLKLMIKKIKKNLDIIYIHFLNNSFKY